MSASLASAGTLGSSSSFLSAITAIYNYAYLSSTTTAAATASLAAGSTTAASYSAATSSAAVSTAAAAIASSPASAALVCALLQAATNSSSAAASSQYRTLCLAASSPQPSPAQATDYTWLAPLIVCTLAGVLLFALAATFVIKWFHAEANLSRRGNPAADATTAATAVALAQESAGSQTGQLRLKHEAGARQTWRGLALKQGMPLQLAIV